MSEHHQGPTRGARSGLRLAASALPSLFVAAGVVTLLSACNSTAGVGRDASAAGRAVTHAAERTKNRL